MPAQETATPEQPTGPRAFANPPAAGGNYRWLICSLLFAATTINYIDRQILGILKPELQGLLGWTETDFANIVFWFQAAYAAGFLLSGRLIDRIGSRIGLALSVVAWSLAEMAHAAVRTAAGFSAAIWLGPGRRGQLPRLDQVDQRMVPQEGAVLATGLFNSGCNVGGLIAPFLVPWITVRWGWPAAFLVTGGLGFVWLIFWLLLYDHPGGTRGCRLLSGPTS